MWQQVQVFYTTNPGPPPVDEKATTHSDSTRSKAIKQKRFTSPPTTHPYNTRNKIRKINDHTSFEKKEEVIINLPTDVVGSPKPRTEDIEQEVETFNCFFPIDFFNKCHYFKNSFFMAD
jgi:hypothetical protein